jgi:hypothetical protein
MGNASPIVCKAQLVAVVYSKRIVRYSVCHVVTVSYIIGISVTDPAISVRSMFMLFNTFNLCGLSEWKRIYVEIFFIVCTPVLVNDFT